MLSMGRPIERLATLSHELAEALQSGTNQGEAGQQYVYSALLELMQTCTQAADNSPDRIGHVFFSHAEREQLTLLS